MKQSSSLGNIICRVAAGAVLVSMLALGACAGDPFGGSPSHVSSPTATAPKPTATIALQLIMASYCAHLLPLATANQIIPSSTPAVYIAQGDPSKGVEGSCNYMTSRSLSARYLLYIEFMPYQGPDSISVSEIQSLLSQATGTSVTVSTVTAVTGIGDQAAYTVGESIYNGFTSPIHVFYVLEGSFIFDCITWSLLSPELADQSQLQQCATTVDANLRTA